MSSSGGDATCDAIRNRLRRNGITSPTAAWLPGRRSHLPRAAAASEDDDDLHTLPVHADLCGTRARSFPDAVGAMLEDPVPDFLPSSGPRATRWLLLGPAARHHQWRRMLDDTNKDLGFDEHIFLCELLRNLLRPTQLPQLCVHGGQRQAERHAEKWQVATCRSTGAAHAIAPDLFWSGSRPKEMALVATTLERWFKS